MGVTVEVLLPSCKGFKDHSAMFAICVGGVVETLMERWERRMRVFKQYVKGLFPCLKNLLCILVLLTTQPPLLSSRDKLGFKYTCRRQPGVPHALTDMF